MAPESAPAHPAEPVVAPLFPGPEGWCLSPEGAAVHPGERIAVIADVHLGYEWARGNGGDCVPAHSLAETLTKLSQLLGRSTIERLVVAGDLVESHAPCPRTLADVRQLGRWLADRGVSLVLLAGNHDPRQYPPLPDTCLVAGWTIAHGHRPLAPSRTISGHVHPVFRASGVTAPSFLVGPETIVLPAFSANAAGWNVAAGTCPPPFPAGTLRCLASTGTELLDFGTVARLAGRFEGR